MRMLIATLFIIAKNWKQPRYPSIGECINKLVHLCNVHPYNTTKGKKK